MQLKVLVSQFTEVLDGCSDSPKLDAECLIAAWLKKPRSFLYAYPEEDVLPDPALLKCLYRRQAGEPIAYIVGNKPFWTLDLKVTPDVLVPRPETECLVEWVLDSFDNAAIRCADLGTGSGAIACALAHERPAWAVVATDQSEAALEIAEENAQQHGLSQIQFHHGDWCQALPDGLFDLIVSNPPYIAEDDPHVEAAVKKFEPQEALFAQQQGLADIAKIIEQAKAHLKPGGYLVLEHGFAQAQTVQAAFESCGYKTIECHEDLNCLPRFTSAVLF